MSTIQYTNIFCWLWDGLRRKVHLIKIWSKRSFYCGGIFILFVYILLLINVGFGSLLVNHRPLAILINHYEYEQQTHISMENQMHLKIIRGCGWLLESDVIWNGHMTTIVLDTIWPTTFLSLSIVPGTCCGTLSPNQFS